MKSNIVLCGFMGSGKTTVGKQLADLTDCRLFDSDLIIEQEEKLPVKEIFARFGEDYFRRQEADVIGRLSKESGVIISVGGGAVMSGDNAAALKSTGFVVFLDATPETVIKRLENDRTRPLFSHGNETAVQSLMEKRRAAYKAAADVTVDAGSPAEDIARKILTLYSDKLDKPFCLL